MTKQERKKEFIENRTSWEWFQRLTDDHKLLTELTLHRLLIEILKELQYMNDKKG